MKHYAQSLLKDLMGFMLFRGPLPEEGRALETIEKHLSIEGEVQIRKKDTFRSKPTVNHPDDMVRVTLDMPLHTWRKLKPRLNTKG